MSAMPFAEQFATPVEGEIGPVVDRRNEFGEPFRLRWGRLRFNLARGPEANLKVVLKIDRHEGVREHYIVDADPYDVDPVRHRRVTRDFFLDPRSRRLGPATGVKFSFIVHLHGRSIPSEFDYAIIDGDRLVRDESPVRFTIGQRTGANTYRTHEVDAALLQRDVDWYNHHFDALRVVPKFTKGTPGHPFHPKRAIHDLIDHVVRLYRERRGGGRGIEVCVDCIDDADFVNHLIFAREAGVPVQCVVDWRKAMLTDSDNYARLKRSRVELVGVFCIQHHPSIEVATDMHTKFIVFGEDDCLQGSFNITFDRWGSNWESGLVFHSQGVCRLLDNVFQSIRGGVIQRYGIDPLSPFNLLYTFGVHTMRNSRTYRPHQAILAEINRARRSLRLCLFTIGELRGEYDDSVVDALIQAHRRGVDVRMILNGHVVRQGDPARQYTMAEELRRPLLPSVARLLRAGVRVALAYGLHDQRVPYCPIHSKYCVIDEEIVIEGSFNWYNTSVYSHDLLVIAANSELARAYLHEFDQILRLFRFPAAAYGVYSAPEAASGGAACCPGDGGAPATVGACGLGA